MSNGYPGTAKAPLGNATDRQIEIITFSKTAEGLNLSLSDRSNVGRKALNYVSMPAELSMAPIVDPISLK
jgi:hypothetical protein